MFETDLKEERGCFAVDIPGLLGLLGRSLYSQPEMFVRELLQNAQDSVVARHGAGETPEGRIDILIDRDQRTISFQDKGRGMTKKEIVEYLCTIGKSLTRELKETIRGIDRERAERLIGRYGIGILAAFMVADKVEIFTRTHTLEEPGRRWIACGGSDYLMTQWPVETPGTTTKVWLKEEFRYLTNGDTLRAAVRKYADFLPFPIYVDGEGPVNSMQAPWHRSYSSESERTRAYAQWVEQRFSEPALEVIPVKMRAPHRVEGVLYISPGNIPATDANGTVDIYQSRMFVKEGDMGLLPSWAKFVRGVIDSPALTPTAARDAVQEDQVHDEIRRALGVLVVETLKRLAQKDNTRFRLIMQWHHYHIKGMAIQFDDFFDAIADTVIFEVSIPEEMGNSPFGTPSFRMITLPEYLELQEYEEIDAEGKRRKVIYYIREAGAASQLYRICQARGLVVINAGLVFDEEFLKKCAWRRPDQVVLQRVDMTDNRAVFDELPNIERKKYLTLEFELKRLLKKVVPGQAYVVVTERFPPSDIPAVFTQTRDKEVQDRLEHLLSLQILPSAMVETFREALGAQMGHRSPVVLHLNATCPLIERLCCEDLKDPVVEDTVMALVSNALLACRQHLGPHDFEKVHSQTVKALGHLLRLRRENRKLLGQDLQKKEHQGSRKAITASQKYGGKRKGVRKLP